MKGLAWTSLILTILVGADGIYMLATKYQPKDHYRFNLSDGGTMIVAAVILLIVTIIAFIAAGRSTNSQSTSNQVKEG